MPSLVRSFRATTDKFARWQAAAKDRGMTFNAWATQALTAQAELDEALARERDAETRGA